MNGSRYLTQDERGEMLGLPLELLIIVVVMAMAIPMIYGFGERYVQEQIDKSTKRELKYLIDEAQDVFEKTGESQRVVTLSLTDHSLARIDFIEIGGGNIHDMNTIRYCIEGRKTTLDLEDLLIANITNSRPQKIDLVSGETSLFLRGASVDDQDLVEIGPAGGSFH